MTATESDNGGSTALSQRLIESGHRLEDAGDILGALGKYEEAVAASPSLMRAHLNLGNALQRLGRTPDAVAALEAALALDPACAPCRFNLGNVHSAAGDFAAAEREFRAALALDPALANAAIALANALESQQRPLEAEQQLRGLLAAKSDCAAAAYNLGLLLLARDECDSAEAMFRACLQADPTFPGTFTALGNLLRNAGRSKDAEPWYRKALAIDPLAQETWSAMLLSYNNRDDLSAQDVLAEHLRFGAAFPPRSTAVDTGHAPARGHARIRLGYLSGDFIQHPVALFLRPVLMHHDRTRFELFCYSNNAREDGMTRDLRSRVDHWRNIAAQDDAAAVTTIRDDDLDILIDLSGHSARSRILLFNHRCAPVQATWLGYLNTTGLRSTDFRICDRHTDPVGTAEAYNTEALLRLPDSQWCYLPVFDTPSGPAHERGSPECIVFGSFNHASKVSDRCIDLWCRVLRAVPGSVIRVFAVPSGGATTALRQRFEQQGIDGGRVVLHPRTSIDAYFAAIGDVDIALDTFPYNGGTTTCDVLWMEAPLVALAGDRPAARSGVSILTTLGLPELIASDDDDYVAINVRLATDGSWRDGLRGTLRARMQASPLMDAAHFVRGFEDGVRRMLGR
jgi:predicted O-linked N-acetylglucosamine transferase (SPINDLY family)